MTGLLLVFEDILIVYGILATLLSMFFTLILAVFVAHTLFTQYRSDRYDVR
jgi:predicted membrane protein